MPDHESEIKPKKNKSEENHSQELLEHPSYQELLKKLDEAEQKINQYWERILRMQADSENAARRIERDIANAHKYALEKFVLEQLPIIDSLEMCIAIGGSSDMHASTKSVIEGVKLTLKMFYTAMEKFGIKQINPISQPFDPELHQAISLQSDPSVKPGTVLSVLQKGYTLNNRLIRPALVVVSESEKKNKNKNIEKE